MKINTFYAALISIFLLVFLFLLNKIYLFGDDIGKIFMLRSFPIPIKEAWIANRVIDDFFSAFSFQTFDHIVSFLSFFPGIQALNFFDKFQIFNALIFSLVFIGYFGLFNFNIDWDFNRKENRKLISLLIVSGFLPSIIIYHNMTMLFAYQISALITLAFLFYGFPIGNLVSKEKNNTEYLQAKKSPNLFLLSILSYLTAMSMEAFVIYSWIYIFIYSLILYIKLRVRNIIKFRFKDNLRSFFVVVQFLIFSMWSFYHLLNSGRTKSGLLASATSEFKFPKFDYNIFFTPYSSLHISLILLIIVFYLAILILMINSQKFSYKPLRRKLFESVYFLSFVFFIYVFYNIFLIFLSELTHINYLVKSYIRIPLDFLILLLLIYYTKIFLFYFNLRYLKEVLIVLLVVSNFVTYINASYFYNGNLVMVKNLKKAYHLAANSSGNCIMVDFELPGYPNGYPILPGPNAPNWYRNDYRKVLNNYYGTDFSVNGPIFISCRSSEVKECYEDISLELCEH